MFLVVRFLCLLNYVNGCRNTRFPLMFDVGTMSQAQIVFGTVRRLYTHGLH